MKREVSVKLQWQNEGHKAAENTAYENDINLFFDILSEAKTNDLLKWFDDTM